MTDTDKKSDKKGDTANEEAPALLNKDRIDALDTENFDAVDYQEDGQGGPKKGLEKEYKKES
ncbi:hypothetical protein [Sphingomicrobium lutaoense]|uniref:Uncharacterized protein n=1 Tax=Sphingomicrobium lutaoense TaxID=515949 RepID=A0A839Z3A9_9SPHN|nr:hypothetical protein [Sphingomicrobium lutaoense]MBB3764092.1 hypothetical protein [Sphingomicrobium lutaoense]